MGYSAVLRRIWSEIKVTGRPACPTISANVSLPAINHVAGDKFIFQQDSAPSSAQRSPTPNFFFAEL